MTNMKLPKTMRAVEISMAGGPEVLQCVTRPVPVPEFDQVLIKIRYAGVNRPDCLQRAGLYAPPKGASDIPGLEASGTIVAMGAGVTCWSIGDAVCALLPGGGYADYAVCSADHALPIPLDLKNSAALPETYFTVWFNLFQRAGIKAGQSILIHGGSSGIGTTAIQLANWAGLRVFVTAGSDAKCAACIDLGAERAINYHDDDFVASVKDATDDKGVDHILDMVGGDYTPRNIKALARGGTLSIIAHLTGAKSVVNVNQIMVKMLRVTGSTLRPQSEATKAAIANDLKTRVWPLIASGQIEPIIAEIYDLEDAAKAHTHMERGDLIGKIVLTVEE
jgi:putative PIG3 family NAD(P)H quinone oxidoreductase